METDYIWRGYARYNKSRCQYILSLLGIQTDWEQSLKDALDERRTYAERYEKLTENGNFPAVISYNLRAEYYHATLEYLCYRHNQNEEVSSEHKVISEKIVAWTKKSAFYGDTLEVTEKQKRLQERIKGDK